ncbi:MAG: CPBP family glutamic-type intramembrane protease [Deinococcales bacterium]
MRRTLILLPSVAIGVAGGVWLLVRGARYAPRLALGWQLAAGVGLGLALLAVAWLLERSLPSFRFASRLMEQALRSLALPAWSALPLAAVTAVGEELFFRGALLGLFGLFHPVPRRGWAYPAYAALAGLALGALTLAAGSLLPAMVAHFGVNLQGFWQAQGGNAAGGDGGVTDAADTPQAHT